MNKKTTYSPEWISILKGLEEFQDREQLIRALQEGKIRSTARCIDEKSDGRKSFRADISKETWEDCSFNSDTGILTGTLETDYGETLWLQYVDIEVSVHDIENITEEIAIPASSPRSNKPRSPNQKRTRKSELHQIIGTVYFDLIERGENNPSATDVWNSLKRRQSEFSTTIQEIVGFDKILWRSSGEKEQTIKRARFETVVSKFRQEKRKNPNG